MSSQSPKRETMADRTIDDPNLEYHPFKSERSDRRLTREKSLSEDEFERLLEGASRLDDLFDLEARFIILMAGRLGMRRGEIVHMKKDWVDMDEQVISVPKHEPCDKGRDGGCCAYCEGLAKQMSEINDIDLERALSFYWKPKTEMSAREIPYGFNERCVGVVEEFFGRFDEYYNSSTAAHRRVDQALEQADGLEPEDSMPHSLRSTAASHLVGLGVNSWSLQHFMGWAWPNTAQFYVRKDAKQLSTTMNNLVDE